jgi:flagellar motor switch protein FliN/FliY
MTAPESTKNIDLLLGVPMQVTVQLGKAEMLVRDILRLNHGSVVELDRAAGGAVDLLVNERLVARGEIVSIEENFGIRISEIVAPAGQHGATDTPRTTRSTGSA